MASRPPDAVILERAKSLCNEACFTVALQHRRLRSEEPEDRAFIFRWHADLQFMIVALQRLRRTARLAAQVLPAELKPAVQAFDAALPNLAKMRNVGEHVDDYVLGMGRTKGVHRSELQVSRWNGSLFTWLGVELDIDVALKAAEALFSEVSRAVKAVAPKRTASENRV